ncbi:MAG: hypothetical protein GY720_01755 [bacterium]|nr:hypothetical protein [bacterium]
MALKRRLMISVAIVVPILILGIALVSFGVSEGIVRPVIVVVAVALLLRFAQPASD